MSERTNPIVYYEVLRDDSTGMQGEPRPVAWFTYFEDAEEVAARQKYYDTPVGSVRPVFSVRDANRLFDSVEAYEAYLHRCELERRQRIVDQTNEQRRRMRAQCYSREERDRWHDIDWAWIEARRRESEARGF